MHYLSTIGHLSVLTIILDALGMTGILTGGYVAIKSTYIKENTKDAAILIDTQRKRIDDLVETVERHEKEGQQRQKDFDKMVGKLESYKELALIKPDILAKLSSTLDAILVAINKNSILPVTQEGDL